jgi:hypothetical protein
MELTEWLGLLTLVIGVPLNVAATLLLLRKSREAPHLRVLRERFLVAVVTTVAVLLFGLIFVNNDQTVPPLDLETTKWITRLAMLGLAVIPAAGWILVWRKLGRYRKP